MALGLDLRVSAARRVPLLLGCANAGPGYGLRASLLCLGMVLVAVTLLLLLLFRLLGTVLAGRGSSRSSRRVSLEWELELELEPEPRDLGLLARLVGLLFFPPFPCGQPLHPNLTNLEGKL